MRTFEELRGLVLQWASDRDILKNSNPQTQMLKLVSEIGEVAEAIKLLRRDDFRDGIGDCLVVLVILSELLDRNPLEMIDKPVEDVDGDIQTLIASAGGLADAIIKGDGPGISDGLGLCLLSVFNLSHAAGCDPFICFDGAYEVIKHRKGRLSPSGAFIKEEDDHA
jgi:hypothetical protein